MWFAERLLHSTVVIVCGAAVAEAFLPLLRRFEPQAFLVYGAQASTRAVAPLTRLRRAEMDALRVADVVLCAMESTRRFAAEVSPGAVCLVPRCDSRYELVDAMSYVGVAPPRAAAFG